jgi:hypothetical protein
MREVDAQLRTTFKMIIIGILAILVALSSGSYSIIQVNAQGSGAQQEQESQTALQKQDCMQLKAKMANDEAAAVQYKSKDCESLLHITTAQESSNTGNAAQESSNTGNAAQESSNTGPATPNQVITTTQQLHHPQTTLTPIITTTHHNITATSEQLSKNGMLGLTGQEKPNMPQVASASNTPQFQGSRVTPLPPPSKAQCEGRCQYDPKLQICEGKATNEGTVNTVGGVHKSVWTPTCNGKVFPKKSEPESVHEQKLGRSVASPYHFCFKDKCLLQR